MRADLALLSSSPSLPKVDIFNLLVWYYSKFGPWGLCFYFLHLTRVSIIWIFVAVDDKCVYHRVRTSSGTFLVRGQDHIIKRIEKRIADFTFIPVGM